MIFISFCAILGRSFGAGVATVVGDTLLLVGVVVVALVDEKSAIVG